MRFTKRVLSHPLLKIARASRIRLLTFALAITPIFCQVDMLTRRTGKPYMAPTRTL
jgi:hypothetical protein